jgi:LysM repeat protein
VIYFDEVLARQTLESIAADLNVTPENAYVEFQDGSWHALPGTPGREVDVEATLDGLFQNAFTNLVSGSALLVIEPVQPEISDLSPLLDEINTLLSQDLVLHAYDPILNEALTWSVPDEAKREWIAINPDTSEVQLTIPLPAIKSLIQAWDAELGADRSLAGLPKFTAMKKDWQEGNVVRGVIVHEPTTYLVGVGESLWSISLKLGMPMWHILDANPGLTTSNIAAGMNLTIPSPNVLLPLEPVENKRIVIDISEQRMTVYEDGQVRSTHIISTGIPDSPTMPGIFQIQTHEINAYASNWDLYMPHFMGIYEAWPGFMNGIHGLPLLSNGQRLWASSLGTPASYGCIILDLGAAEDLYYWADPGVVVEITR